MPLLFRCGHTAIPMIPSIDLCKQIDSLSCSCMKGVIHLHHYFLLVLETFAFQNMADPMGSRFKNCRNA
jgi:hypothetical protein